MSWPDDSLCFQQHPLGAVIMKTSSLAIAFSGMLLASSVAAQPYSGLYLTAGGSLQAMVGKDFSNFGADGSFTTMNSDLGKDAIQAKMALGYLHNLSDKFLIGVEIGKQLGQRPSLKNSITSNQTSGGDVSSEARQWKIDPGWSLALKPSVILGNDSLVFIKLSKYWASGTFNGHKGINCADAVNATGCDFPISESFSANTNGTGLGAGLQTRLTDKLFLVIEVERISYGKISRTVGSSVQDFINADALKPQATTGTISLGYWF